MKCVQGRFSELSSNLRIPFKVEAQNKMAMTLTFRLLVLYEMNLMLELWDFPIRLWLAPLTWSRVT
jgi:hypothetical protein